MIKHKLFKMLFTAIIIITVISFAGCEKKNEQNEMKSENAVTDTSSSVNTTGENKPIGEEKATIPDIKGTWTGTFDKRATTLTITEQTDSSFSGKITINYRQVINQEVKGSFSPTTRNITMTDQLHSRYQGKYNGKLSQDLDNFSGTFIMKVDGSKFQFNLNKK